MGTLRDRLRELRERVDRESVEYQRKLSAATACSNKVERFSQSKECASGNNNASSSRNEQKMDSMQCSSVSRGCVSNPVLGTGTMACPATPMTDTPATAPCIDVSAVFEKVIINKRSFLVIDEIGRGGSSKVYQVVDQADKKCYALKRVDLRGPDDKLKDAYLNEIDLLKRLRDSGCVVKLIDWEIQKHNLYIVVEKGDVDLATFLKTRRHQIDDIFIQFYWNEMLKCVSAIHKEGIVHSDLKPANFLLVEGNLKLIDFGIASAIPLDATSVEKENSMGTLSYMAPESIAGVSGEQEKCKVHRKVDVWSLGCILYNMVYGESPYQNYRKAAEKIVAIMHKPISFRPIKDANLLDVLKRCLAKDPSQRATIEELQNHPYLKRKDVTNREGLRSLDYEMDYFSFAQQLKQCTPRTSARKLRDLVQRGKVNDQESKG